MARLLSICFLRIADVTEVLPVLCRGCCLSGVALLSLARAIKFDLVRQIIILSVRLKSRQITASVLCHRMTMGKIG